MNHLEEVRAKVIETVYGTANTAVLRPLRLSDVLVALRKGDEKLFIDVAGTFWLWSEHGAECLSHWWNLHADSLDYQNQECIDFLYSVLCV